MPSDLTNFICEKIFNVTAPFSITDDYSRHKMMIYVVITPGIFFTIILSFFALHEGEYQLLSINCVLIIFLAVLFCLTRADRYLRSIVFLITLVGVLFYMTLFTLGLGRNQSFVWYYCIPPITFFFYGRKGGFLISVSVMLISILIVLLQDYIPFYSPYPDGLLVRFFISYLFVTIISYMFELTRSQTKKELVATLEQLKEETIIDSLTQLYNRRYFDEVTSLIFRQNDGHTSIAYIMLDIDFFKQYNDTYGHQSGDVVLQEFSNVLKAQTKRSTDYAFRYGGEEFFIILTSVSLETAHQLTSSIISATEKMEIEHKKSQYRKITVSAGIAFIENIHNEDKWSYIKQADDMLYEAKKSGRNCYKMTKL